MALKDLARRIGQAVPGAVARQTAVLISVAVGLLLALSLVSQVGTYRHKVIDPVVSQHAPAPREGGPSAARP
jgi:hypothetical protein